jgi:MFS transporter, FHS family, L-fucose permease
MAQLPTASITATEAPATTAGKNKYLVPFILVTSLFFLWGMAHNLDSILIPHLKKACQLNNRQSTLVDTSIFLAYFLMAIPAGMFLKRFGYKTGIICGLLVFACGAFIFLPAANARSYELFLLGLFVIGCGLAVLETAANPYAAILGPPEAASTRLNLAASFNGLAAVIAPMIGTAFILSGVEYSPAELANMQEEARLAYLNAEAASVKMPYLILGIVLIAVAVLFYFFRFPEVKDDSRVASPSQFIKAFRHRHLSWAVIAQFTYVGAQVCVTSFFLRTAQNVGGLNEETAGYSLIIYGILFMVGRFIGTFFLRFVAPHKLLSIYAVIAALLSLLAIFGEGAYLVYSLGALGFFMSIMFPTIFSLGIEELGQDTKIGASLLVMSIVGGAIFPYLMGTIIDMRGDDIQAGYIVPLACFLVILYFGLKGYKVITHQKAVELD